MTDKTYPIINNSEEYPEVLSWDQFDNVDWSFTKDIKEEHFDGPPRVAAEFVLKLHQMLNQPLGDDQPDDEGYVIYTLSDPDGQYRIKGSKDAWDDYPVYYRDYHLVNRVGVWIIVKHNNPESIDVGELEWRDDEEE